MGAAPTIVVDPVFFAEGDNFRVNTSTVGSRDGINATPLEGGGYVVTWVTDPATHDERVHAQVFDSDGTALGPEFAVAPGIDEWQRSASVVSLADGGFAVGWSVFESGVDHRVLTQRYDAAGAPVGDMITVATLTTSGFSPTTLDLSALPGGGFLATWCTNNSDGDVMARLYGADGAPLGDAFQVNTYTTGIQGNPETAVLADDSIVVVWNSQGQDGDGDGVYAQRLSAAGSPVGSEFRVNTVTAGLQGTPNVTALAGGGFVISWQQPDIFDPTQIKAQVYDASGVAVGGEIIVDSFNTPGSDTTPVIAGLPDGGFVVAWYKDFNEVRAQRYEADGTPRGAAFDVSSSEPGVLYVRGASDIIVTDGGELIVFWHQAQNPDSNDSEVFAQRYQLDNRATEQVSLPIANAITVGDDGLGSNVVTVTLSVDFGTLTVAVTGTGVGASGNGTASVTLTGTVDQLNALLAGGPAGAVSYLANSDTPPAGATLSVLVTDAEDLTASSTIAIVIAAVDDPAVALPDAATTTEAASTSGNLFADNGSGADFDPDGPEPSVTAVNGSAAAVGTTITLASGALLTVQANGNYFYDPNGQFTALPGAASGASNLVALDSFTYTLAGGGTATVTLTVTGLDSTDSLLGTAGNDTLNGGVGADTMAGGAGDDRYYIDATGDAIQETSGGGSDTAYVAVSYTLTAGAEVERLSTIQQSATTAINLTGNASNQTIYGNAGANDLDGKGGSDTLIGLGGADTYYVDDAGDVIREAAGGGFDIAYASASYVLTTGAYVEALSTDNAASTAAINLTGNASNQTINGNAGANVLDGKGGDDQMNGKGGDDTYYVDAAGDDVNDAIGGTDTVYTSVSYKLGPSAHVERFSTILHTDTAAINLTGNAFVQTIYGNAGVNVLDGRVGSDTMIGLGGDDRYYVDNAGDVIEEASGGGSDTAYAAVSYVLTAGAEVETLSTIQQSATTAIDLTGNALAQTIYGNAGNNVLDGKGGSDTLIGLGGDDTYYVDAAGDVIQEAVGGGSDRAYAKVSYVLTAGAEVERLATTNDGSISAINLTGNAFAQTITGNAGANVLDGKAGNDTMIGLGGNDTYHVDNAGDVIQEASGEGTDRAYTTVSYTLGSGARVEIFSTIQQTATTAIDLTGNGTSQTIYGNAGANVLDGKLGNDVLVGLGGADTFAFTTALGAGNVDTITGYSVADDTIRLDNDVFTGLSAGALAAGAFAIGAAATQADDRIIYNSATGALMFDADGSGAGAAVQFALLSTGLAMTASDFLVV